MMQNYMFDSGVSATLHGYLDYLQGRLYHPLVAGKSYCVTFYVVNEYSSRYAVNMFGAYLDDGSIDTAVTHFCGTYLTQYTQQIVDTPVVSDTVNWTKVQGSFTANGTERFIAMGQFIDPSIFTKVVFNANYIYTGTWAEYLIDDVSVIASDDTGNAGPDRFCSATSDSVWVGDTTGYLPCYWYAGKGTAWSLIDSNTAGFKVKPDTTTKYVMVLDVCGTITTDTAVVYVAPVGVRSRGSEVRDIKIYPNPATNQLTIEGVQNCEIIVYDILGSEKLKIKSEKLKEVVNISSLNKGIYSVAVIDLETGMKVVKKLVKE